MWLSRVLGLDTDGDGVDDAVMTAPYYSDGESYEGGAWGWSAPLVDGDGDGAVAADDCDDADAAIAPEVDERCDGVDQDCDGVVDDDPVDGTSWCADADGDGAGDPSTRTFSCTAVGALVADCSDCDDGDAAGACDTGPDDASLLAGCDVGAAAVLEDGQARLTVQEAIDDADDGAVVSVCPGTWVEDLVVSHDVSIVGAGSSRSILSGTSAGSVVRVPEGVEATVSRVEITGGTGTLVGSLRYGGGVYVEGSLSLEEATVSGNTADVGGGVNVYDRAWITSSEISGNTAGDGGGFAVEGRLVMRGGELSANTAEDGGGGWFRYGYAGLTGVDVSDNLATGNGGGLWMRGAQASIARGTVRGNTAAGAGGVYVYRDDDSNADVVLADLTIEGNTATGTAGGLAVVNDVARVYGVTAWVIGVTLQDNVAAECGGGMLYQYYPGSLTVQHLTVDGNTADTTGGLCATGVELFQATLTNNVSANPGGALSGYFWLVGGRVAANSAPQGGGVWTDASTAFLALGTDWGTSGVDDNTPEDIGQDGGRSLSWDGVMSVNCWLARCRY